MTTKQANAAELARIGDCDYHIQQAAAEGRRELTALENWEYLFFQKGAYAAARAWWFSEIEPATRQEA